MSRILLPRMALASVVAAVLFAGPVAAEEVSGLSPASPQPSADSLRPGLAVTYYNHKFGDTREISEFADYRKGKAGEPIKILDYWVGDGDVLTSGRADHVGAFILGLIRFPKAGVYTFSSHTNDGIDLKIGGKPVIRDTGIHSDRYSELVAVKIDKPGWYPLELLYFEREHTSTLELFWLQPGELGQLNHVPEEAFAHIVGTRPGS